MAGISGYFERLAEIVDEAESEGTTIRDTDTYIHNGALFATVEVKIDEGPTVSHTHEPACSWSDGDENGLEDGEEHLITSGELASISIGEPADNGDGQADVVDADASAVDPGDEPAPSTPAESDIVPGDLEDGEGEEDDFDPDEAVERLKEKVDELEGGLEDGEQYYLGEEPKTDDTDDQPRPEDLEAEEDPEPPADSLASEVLATLREEGELAGPEIKTITGAGSDMYTALGDLQDDDLVEKRKDPDDGRRTLYRPAGWLVDDEDDEEPEWNGRDPETIVADSSLPARVVLDDILDDVSTADTVIDLAEQLDVDVDNLEPVCWHLTLKQADSLTIVENVDERVETIREVVEA